MTHDDPATLRLDRTARQTRTRYSERLTPLAPGRIEVEYLDGDTFHIAVRGHALTVDQPHGAGGGDLGPSPVELFVSSLAACVAHYAGRYLHRHGIPRDGLRVTAGLVMAEDRPPRVASVRMAVTVPADLTEQQRKALGAVVDHCTVHNTLRQPPHIDTRIV